MKMFRSVTILFLKLTTLVSANNHHIHPPQTVEVSTYSTIRHTMRNHANLNLITNSYLANENLPVWIAYAENPNMLEPLSQVMNKIGPFSIYHDEKTCSAAIYFHKYQIFDGTIRLNLRFDAVDYNTETEQLELSENNFYKVESQLLHAEATNRADPILYQPEIEETEFQEKLLARRKYVKSRLPDPNVVYVETLIIINYDLAMKFRNNAKKIVSHILVLMNNVDMLYSKVDEPRIKINIAGIIIGDKRESFPAFVENNCYIKYKDINSVIHEGLHIPCVFKAMKSSLLKNYEETITLQSYDVVILLTSIPLQYDISEEALKRIARINGFADLRPNFEMYEGFQSSTDAARVAVINIPDDDYQSSSIVAHEMAHLFDVLHDNGGYRDFNLECTGTMMQSPGSFCMRCLYFSERSLQHLKHFFGCRDGCIFRNIPKSLVNPQLGAKKFWNGDNQCACYGYEKEFKMQPMSLWNSVVNFGRGPSVQYCEDKLKCEHKKWGIKTYVITTFLMDGTPCDIDKVCWNHQCVPIAN